MNKIVIVGHPLSGYQEVQSLLNSYGMAVAQPSRREGFMPEQISTTLCKVHDTPLLTQLESEDHIKQIEAGPVWHGMALDLMLGNLEQPIWGWADPQAIYLLNYWRDLDPSITFILVYDRPHSVLTHTHADEATGLSADSLSARTRNWAAYNAAMLHFFHRNPQRCLLVHSQQVRESAGSYLQQVRARINAPWSERMQELAAPETLDESPSTPAALVVDHTAVLGSPAASPQNALTVFLAEALLQQHPASLQLYQELQAAANLPLADGADVVVNGRSALDAWQAMAASDTRLIQTENLVQQKQQLIERISRAQAQAEQLALERQRIIDEQTSLHHSQTEASQHRLDELQRDQQALKQAQQTSRQENELLLTQLHQVQEALEHQHLQSQLQAEQATQEQTRLAAAQQLADQRVAELGQLAEQLKQQLTDKEQLAQTQAAQVNMSLAEKLASEQENELLLTQLHQVQEELERYYVENQKLKQGSVAPAKPAAPVKPRATAHYGAADRIKRQLTYRLGAKMISQSQSFGGWLTMPTALLSEARDFRRDQAARASAKLPPIHTYADAYDADRVKQHLSYRLGATLMTHAKTPVGWVKMPFALRREVKDFRKRKHG